MGLCFEGNRLLLDMGFYADLASPARVAVSTAVRRARAVGDVWMARNQILK